MVSQTLFKYIADLLPAVCEVCRFPMQASKESRWYCDYCHALFTAVPRCTRCGLPMSRDGEVCGACLVAPPKWHRLYCVGDYQPPLSQMVHKFKYERQFWHASKLASLLSERVVQKPDLITCVPLHWRRYWWRGFNQSEQLAISVSQTLKVDYQPLFRRIRATPQQQGLTKRQREQNLQQAFEMCRNVEVDHVAIIDDVLTTGSTVAHLCQLLLDANVKTIDIYCVCRTPEP